MQFIRGLANLSSLTRSVVTIGNFDGVHLGHQALLAQLALLVEQYQAPSVLIIFEPTPAEFFLKEKAPARLMRLREKLAALKKFTLDYVLCLRFNKQLATLSAEDFVREILVKRLGVKALVVGDDFRFGENRRGDFQLLSQMGRDFDFVVHRMSELSQAAERVSSTRIRAELQRGDFLKAAACLGTHYSVSGRVVYGRQLGRQLGFPTANIQLHRKVVPMTGIFVVEIHGLNQRVFQGVANLGTRPTVDGSSRVLLEVYIFDFSADIYGHYVQVDFLKKLRDEERYDSLEELKTQIALDVEEARRFFA